MLSLPFTSMQSTFYYAVPYGNHGCSGGRAHNTYDYIINNGGVDLVSYYPFKGRVSLGDQDNMIIWENSDRM